MAGEEDSELRDLVAQSLEAKGVLGKIRAQLRASVFLAMEEQGSKEQNHPLENERLAAFMKTKEGQLTAGLVREFLEFFELDFTCSVFDPESNVLNSYVGREKLAAQVGLLPSADSPVLLEVLRQAKDQPRPPYIPLAQLPPLSTGAGLPLVSATTSANSTAAGSVLTQPAFTGAVHSEVSQVAAGSASAQHHHQQQPVNEESSSRPTGPGLLLAADSDSPSLDPKFFTPSGREAEHLASSSLRVDHVTGFGGGGGAESSKSKSNSQQDGVLPPTRQNSGSVPQGPPPQSRNGELAAKGHSSGSDDESLSGLLSAKYETTDHSLSQLSTAGDFDYTEPVQ